VRNCTPSAGVPSSPVTRPSPCAYTTTTIPGARCEWEAPVGFVDGWHSFGLILLDNVGFLDHFTVMT
jgi:hypothetical protein